MLISSLLIYKTDYTKSVLIILQLVYPKLERIKDLQSQRLVKSAGNQLASCLSFNIPPQIDVGLLTSINLLTRK